MVKTTFETFFLIFYFLPVKINLLISWWTLTFLLRHPSRCLTRIQSRPDFVFGASVHFAAPVNNGKTRRPVLAWQHETWCRETEITCTRAPMTGSFLEMSSSRAHAEYVEHSGKPGRGHGEHSGSVWVQVTSGCQSGRRCRRRLHSEGCLLAFRWQRGCQLQSGEISLWRFFLFFVIFFLALFFLSC